MVIEEKDFRLIPVNEFSPLYDLELLCIIKPKDKEPRAEFKNVAYGISLDNAIKKIAHYRVQCNHKNESIRLVSYFNEFKKELDSIKDLCKV